MKIKITFAYNAPKTKAVFMESEWIEEQSIDQLLEDLQRIGRINDITIMDEMGREWNRKEYAKLKVKMELEPSNPHIYFDGGFDVNTRTAAIGVVIYYEKGQETYRLRANAKLEQLETNNEAEYAALYNSLHYLEEIGAKNLPVTISGDAQGVLKQLQGEWPCYEKVLNSWLDRIEAKIADLGLKATYEVISRKENKEADKLATQALEGQLIHSQLKL